MRQDALEMIERSLHIPSFDEMENSPYIVYGDDDNEESQELRCAFCKEIIKVYYVEKPVDKWVAKCDCRDAVNSQSVLKQLNEKKEAYEKQLRTYHKTVKQAAWNECKKIAIKLIEVDVRNLVLMTQEKEIFKSCLIDMQVPEQTIQSLQSEPE